MRKDKTWKAITKGIKAPSEYIEKIKLSSLTRGFQVSIPRTGLPEVDGEILRATLEYSTDGENWNLIVGFGVGGRSMKRRDGSTATESSASIVLLDTIKSKKADPENPEKLIDWYEVWSRELLSGTDVRLRVQPLISLDFECDVHLEEGPHELKDSKPLHHSVAFDAPSTSSGDEVTSLSWSHTCTGSNRGLVVGVSHYSASSAITGITYNGVALASEGGITEGGNGRAEQWSLIAPATGANTVVVTKAASGYIVAGAASFTGANQTDLCGTQATASGTNDAPTVNVSSASGEMVVDVVDDWFHAFTVGADQTQRWNKAITNVIGAGSTEPGAASVTMSWSMAGSQDWAIAAISVKAAAGGRIMSSLVGSGGLAGHGGIAGEGGGLAG